MLRDRAAHVRPVELRGSLPMLRTHRGGIRELPPTASLAHPATPRSPTRPIQPHRRILSSRSRMLRSTADSFRTGTAACCSTSSRAVGMPGTRGASTGSRDGPTNTLPGSSLFTHSRGCTTASAPTATSKALVMNNDLDVSPRASSTLASNPSSNDTPTDLLDITAMLIPNSHACQETFGV